MKRLCAAFQEVKDCVKKTAVVWSSRDEERKKRVLSEIMKGKSGIFFISSLAFGG